MLVMSSSGRNFNLAQHKYFLAILSPLPSFSPAVIYIVTLCHSLTYITDPEQCCLLIYHLICPVHGNPSSSRLMCSSLTLSYY